MSRISTDPFESFWLRFPPRLGVKARKQEARCAWMKLNPSPELIEEIMAGLERYKRVCGDFPVDACRFLRHKRWTDEIVEVAAPEPEYEKRARLAVERTQEYIARMRRGE